ncbi:MAG: cation:proton antiporter [Proteobacteria bacterium]|nr:cation:proton antiporter [Pseudomonadota bacterium]
MDFELVAIALGDVVWISVAFALGFLARTLGLPPLVGFLATGFLLNAQGVTTGAMLEKLADLGITLLLFTVGLKLNPRTLARPQVWGVSILHMGLTTLLSALMLTALATMGLLFFAQLDAKSALLVAFALSFSSTVFAVKALEDRGEMNSLHGRIAIGILIMQDLAAVCFLVASSGKWPSLWAPALLLLLPLRPVLLYILQRVGHGELLVLYGLLLALGGAEVFGVVGLKGDLGALLAGLLVASHPKTDELAKTMLSFKDLFLLGFFLSIGSSGQLTGAVILAGVALVPLVILKTALFLGLLTRFKLRARTALLSSLNLTNYSEFGLIVAATGVTSGWLETDWLIAIAVALAFSFVIAAGGSLVADTLYSRYQTFWLRLQTAERLPDDRPLDIARAKIAIFGMGGIGTGAYDRLRDAHGDTVVGVDIDPITVRNQQATGRNVLLGDPSDADFWDRIQAAHTLDLVMLALPTLATNLEIIEHLKTAGFSGRVAATAKFEDEEQALREAGATTVFNTYTEAGAGFAAHVTIRGLTN